MSLFSAWHADQCCAQALWLLGSLLHCIEEPVAAAFVVLCMVIILESLLLHKLVRCEFDRLLLCVLSE